MPAMPEQGVVCLVLVNGGLVPLEAIKDNIFVAGKQFADNPVNASEHIIGYLAGTESLRAPDKTDIDGISMSANETPPLFCLDIAKFTSLSGGTFSYKNLRQVSCLLSYSKLKMLLKES